MNFIIVLLLIIIIFRLTFWIGGRLLLRYVRKQNHFNHTTEEEAEPKSSQKVRDKIFNKDQGDYVDFEELDKE